MKNENHLRNVKLLSKPIKICIAKATLTASKGTISCTTIINEKEIQVNDVLYVPGLEFNLLSVTGSKRFCNYICTRKRKNIERYESFLQKHNDVIEFTNW